MFRFVKAAGGCWPPYLTGFSFYSDILEIVVFFHSWKRNIFFFFFDFLFLFYNENRLLMLRAIGCSYSYLISFLFVGKKKIFEMNSVEVTLNVNFFFPPDPPRLSIRTGPTAAPSEAPHLHRQTVCFVPELFWTFLFCPFLYTPTVGRLYVYGVFIVSMC